MNDEEKGEPLARKAPVLRWYFGAIKASPLLAVRVMTAAVLSALLLDAAIPYCMALIFDRLDESLPMQQILLPVGVLLVSLVLELGLVPYRLWNRRILEARGHEHLVEKINDAVLDNPERISKLPHGTAVNATEKFLRTWDTLLFTITEQLVTFTVGIASLIVLLSMRAPWALVVVALAILVVVVAARKAAEKVSLTWGKRTRAEAEESSALGGLFSNALMRWLVEALTGPRRLVTEKRSAAATEYGKAAAMYYFLIYGIGTFLKVASVAGGAVMVKLGAISVGTLSLFLVYAFTLSERMHGIFGISEVFGNAAAESSYLLDALDGGEKKPAPVLDENECSVVFKDVRVEYTVTPLSDSGEEGGSKAVIVTLSDVVLFPGRITMFTGPNGTGKSTRLKTASGCQDYAKGSITLAGCEIRGVDIRPHVFYGQQDFNELPVPVRVLFGEHPNEDLLRRAFSYVDYENAPMSRLISELSGGQCRRVFLARLFYAVLTRDRDALGVLCLDEPTNHLDENAIKRLKYGLVELTREDPLLIIALVTHELEMMKDVADQLIEA